MAIDLSEASGDGLKLILLRVPAKDLIGKCTQVSKRWKGILDDNDFWRNKMEEDGYLWPDKICENGNKLEWRKFADLPTKLFKLMALKHCFERNFLKDIWNLEAQDGQVVTFDPRWKGAEAELQMGEDVVEVDPPLRITKPRIEIPPKFVDGEPEIPQAPEKPIAACIAIPFFSSPFIVIKVADEGLTDEIMDNFRPTIFVTAMIANRRDCTSEFLMQCSLLYDSNDVDIVSLLARYVPEDRREIWDERRDWNGSWVRVTIGKRFNLGEGEGWHRMVISIKDYPAGMRYLYLRYLARARGPGIPETQKTSYGIKLANCSVKALLEKNATE